MNVKENETKKKTIKEIRKKMKPKHMYKVYTHITHM